ncbi:hypothetical protein DSO57_1032338 [Entomophthora muscae]|uniref:Uncharacterized protein n=1 Tax=Entomophthora muscae TaxID=34485 RepID=A0ACC2TYY5_9FUNG|nr:hypothetical protein DSO57_1032338 [Entomophthora muscae]
MDNFEHTSLISDPDLEYQDSSSDSNVDQGIKTHDDTASKKSRNKTKAKEQLLIQRNTDLLIQIQEAENRNDFLLKRLAKLKRESNALQAESDILKNSEKLDRELDEEISREIKLLEKHPGVLIPGTMHNNPYELAQRQLQEAQEFYSLKVSKVSNLKEK